MAFAGEGCNARVGASVAVSELAAFGCWVALLSQVERRATHAPCRIYSVLRKCSVPHTTNGWKLHLLAHLTDTVWVFFGAITLRLCNCQTSNRHHTRSQRKKRTAKENAAPANFACTQRQAKQCPPPDASRQQYFDLPELTSTDYPRVSTRGIAKTLHRKHIDRQRYQTPTARQTDHHQSWWWSTTKT